MITQTCASCSILALQIAAHQQVEFLIGAAEFNVGFEGDRVVAWVKRVEQLVQRDRLFFCQSLGEIVALENLFDGHVRRQTDKAGRAEFVHPLGVEPHLGLLGIEQLEDLRLVSFGVGVYLLARELRPRGGFA